MANVVHLQGCAEECKGEGRGASVVSFVAKKLTKVRNGIAHKNAALLSKHLGSGKKLHILDADELVAAADCVPYLLDSTRIYALWLLARHFTHFLLPGRF